MQIYIHRNGQKMGPYSLDEIRSLLGAGSVRSNDLAWYEGAPDWIPLASVPGLKSNMPPAVPRRSISPRYEAPTSGLAIASLVLGILAVLNWGLTGIPAVICGHLSLSQIKRDPGEKSGGGLAIAGLITGYFSLALLTATAIIFGIFAGVLVGASKPGVLASFDSARRQALCFTHAQQIRNGCQAYAKDHNGSYPEALMDLVPKYVPDRGILNCPMLKNDTILGYEYFPGKDTDPKTKVLLISKGETAVHKPLTVTYGGKIE